MDAAGAVAIVTGGASGLGLASARALASRGARVVLLDLPSSGGEAAAAANGAGGSVRFAPGDVRDEAAVARAVDLASELGPLRILVNCAGIAPAARAVGRHGPLELERFRHAIDVNLVGTFNVVRLAAARMLESGLADEEERGVIVNTASVAAFEGQIGQAAYAASKAGVAGMTLPLAREFAEHRIRVMTIAPGTFDTPLLAALPEAARVSLGEQVPHPARLGRPEEFGALVAHIVANPMLNGETIRLDGAIRMAPR